MSGKTKSPREISEDRLDHSVEDTFPASDPPSTTQAPDDKRYTKEPPENDAGRKAPIPGEN